MIFCVYIGLAFMGKRVNALDRPETIAEPLVSQESLEILSQLRGGAHVLEPP